MTAKKIPDRNWWALHLETTLGRYWQNRHTGAVAIPNVFWTLNPWEADLLVVTEARHVYEIEIKVDIQDLRNDSRKRKWAMGGIFVMSRMRQFWYAVPDALADDAVKLVPEWCGVMSVDEHGRVCVHRRAKVSRKARALSEQEYYRVLRAGVFRFWSLREHQMKYTERRNDAPVHKFRKN